MLRRPKQQQQLPLPLASASPPPSRTETRRKKRRRKRRKAIRCNCFGGGNISAKLSRCAVVVLVLASLVGFGAIRLLRKKHGLSVTVDPRVWQHMTIYHEKRQSALSKSSEINWPLSYMMHNDDHLGHNVILSDYASHVSHCNVTVLFLDPRLADPQYGPGEAAWFALESAAAFVPIDACFALLTSACSMERFLLAQSSVSPSVSVDTAIRDKVYTASLPLFRERIQAGRVRLSYIDHQKYQLKACHDFGNPTSALVNFHFWQDEFSAVDSDAVLLLQHDSVLCRTLDATALDGYAFVGAPWPRMATPLLPNPPEGMCWGMQSLWKLLTLHMQPADYTRLGISPFFSNPCDSRGQAPIGNGGFSWRSRAWMQRAIQTCPHVHWSGLQGPSPCRALDEINEDYYFGTVLRALQAPLPSARVASLFSVESLFPEQAMALYGSPSDVHEEDKDGVAVGTPRSVVAAKEDSTAFFSVPVGFHKPWWYHSNQVLLSPAMQSACPYLPFVFTADMSRSGEALGSSAS